MRSRAAASTQADNDRLVALGTVLTSADEVAELVRSHSRLTLNFHPDRLNPDRRSVAAALRRNGRYLPQSITGLSNGGRSAVPGGERTQWEHELFDGAYGNGDLRPVYGTLDITRDPFGGAPRFGSCAVVLSSSCLDRTTFCVGDSHQGPRDVGTIDSFAGIAAGMFEMVDASGMGRDLVLDQLMRALDGASAPSPARDLDHYVETQVHGEISLDRDVEEIIADPSFRDTAVGDELCACAERFDIELRWHEGSELPTTDVPNDFRGSTMAPLAQAAASGGVLDAAAIGRSLEAVPFTPPSPNGDPAEGPLQQHKYLWHCLLRFGHAARSSQ